MDPTVYIHAYLLWSLTCHHSVGYMLIQLLLESNLTLYVHTYMYIGTYPGLPPVDSVDFSLLKEEVSLYTLYVSIGIVGGLTTSGLLCPQAEWCLLFKYVLQFPSLIDEIASLLYDESFRIVAKVNKVSGISYT